MEGGVCFDGLTIDTLVFFLWFCIFRLGYD